MPSLLFGQQAADSVSPSPPSAPVFDRYTIDVEALARLGVARTLSDALVSQLPGLLVIPGSGLNGSGARIRFVGLQSFLADSPPLVFLDGAHIDAREDDSQLVGPGPLRLDDIAIEDVQSIEVLRGPLSTALYGQGAAAGVILIHSKDARSGRVRIEGFGQSGMRAIPSRWPANYGGVDLDNPDPYLRNGSCSLQRQASGGCVQDFVQRFNPLEQRNPFSATPSRQIGVSAAGGPQWGAFRVSGAFEGDPAAYDIPAVTWSDDYRRWNLRASGTAHPARNVDLIINLARVSSNLRLPMYAPLEAGLLGPSDSAGFTWSQVSQNPGTQSVGRTLASLEGRARPARWLMLQAVLGLDELRQRELQVPSTQSYIFGRRTGGQHTLRLSATTPDLSWRSLRFTSTVGVERLKDRGTDSLAMVATHSGSWRSSRSEMRWVGVYGSEQVAIQDRLVLSGAIRHDWFHGGAFGKFASGGTHPTVGLSWIARPERAGRLGRVAIRAAYGTSAPPPARLLEGFIVGPLLNPPPPLRPEKTRTFEVAAEATGFARRIRAQVSAYDSRSTGIGVMPLSAPSGGPVSLYSSGVVIGNRGIAASVNANIIDHSNLGWDLHLSLWGNRNRLLRWTGPPIFFAATGIPRTGQLAAVGYPAGGYWGRPLTSFTDANGDGIISLNEVTVSQSLVWAGTPYPTQGAALTTSWRLGQRIRLSAILDYRAGHTLYNQIADLRCAASLCRERNDPATSFTAQAVAVTADQSTLGYYEDADYLKLREVALAFELPSSLSGVLGARSATVVIGGRNLLTWTKYSGADPEAGSYGISPIGMPPLIADFGTVPMPRSWTLRVRVAY